MEARQTQLLPVDYYHVVFTLPAAIRQLAFYNKAAMYCLLMKAAGQTLSVIANDAKHLGAQIGTTMVLHTWGSAMVQHPNVHCIVPGGGIKNDEQVTFTYKDYRRKGDNRHKTMQLDTDEFIRRFMLHVLPAGFHRIRLYLPRAPPKSN